MQVPDRARVIRHSQQSRTDKVCSASINSDKVPRRCVAVISHVWPNYRLPVMIAMDQSSRINYTFLSGGVDLEGVRHADITAISRYEHAPFKFISRFMWQQQTLNLAACRKYDCVICLGDPNFLSSWAAAIIGRLSRTPVVFWTHGWLRPEHGIRSFVRNVFYRLATHLFVYAERGKQLGAAKGFPSEKMTVVYNSLDVDAADEIISKIEAGDMQAPELSSMFKDITRPLLICTSRLTEKCRFDILFEAACVLQKSGKPVNILLVGDGPERAALEKKAVNLGINVHFFGSCYDETTVGNLIYHADLTVSPGKVGLTAMHSLMYGTPVVTHGNLDEQMPEVEAIEPGETGLLFRKDDSNHLAEAISDWIATAKDRASIRDRSRTLIKTKWHPKVQARIIEDALMNVLPTKVAQKCA